MSKCVSAQWDDALGVDHAAVSYACKVGGSSDGTDSLEVAKQFWKLVPCGSSSSSSSSDDTADDVADTDNSVQFNAASYSSSSKAAVDADFSSSSASSDDDSAPTTTSSASASTQSVDKHDRSTWVCRHDGKWCVVGSLLLSPCPSRPRALLTLAPSHARRLARHYRYVTEAGHIECKDELEAYWASQKRRMARRSRLAHGKAVEKRDDSTYCIIAVDHLTGASLLALFSHRRRPLTPTDRPLVSLPRPPADMATRALTPDQISTFGGYSSLKLANWDENDSSQHWRIISA